MSAVEEQFEVEEIESGTRLDKWLTERLHDLDYEVSRAQVQAWLEKGYISSSKMRLKSSDAVNCGETYNVSVPPAVPIQLEADPIPLDVVFEDDQVVVINKSRGVVVHPGAGHIRETLVNGLIARNIPLSNLGGATRPGVVHRIDKDTSGLLVFAKTDFAYQRLAHQLRAHTMQREYIAIVHGVVVHDEGTIDAPVGRDPRHRQRMGVVDRGKDAVTHFTVQARYPEYSLLALRLETGRTHQIRVHMAYIDHPLAGDPLYGRRHTLNIAGQALHARSLGFKHPTTEVWCSFTADIPDDMGRLIDGLENGLI